MTCTEMFGSTAKIIMGEYGEEWKQSPVVMTLLDRLLHHKMEVVWLEAGIMSIAAIHIMIALPTNKLVTDL